MQAEVVGTMFFLRCFMLMLSGPVVLAVFDVLFGLAQL